MKCEICNSIKDINKNWNNKSLCLNCFNKLTKLTIDRLESKGLSVNVVKYKEE